MVINSKTTSHCCSFQSCSPLTACARCSHTWSNWSWGFVTLYAPLQGTPWNTFYIHTFQSICKSGKIPTRIHKLKVEQESVSRKSPLSRPGALWEPQSLPNTHTPCLHAACVNKRFQPITERLAADCSQSGLGIFWEAEERFMFSVWLILWKETRSCVHNQKWLLNDMKPTSLPFTVYSSM